MATIYAMSGPIGAGKTTLARKLAAEKRGVFFSTDQWVKLLGFPIGSLEDYTKYYVAVRGLIAEAAKQNLKLGTPVVLDFGGTAGHWDWLKEVASFANASIEIFHLEVPPEVRRERVRLRNLHRPAGVHSFDFSDEDFDSMPKESVLPAEQPGLKITIVRSDEV